MYKNPIFYTKAYEFYRIFSELFGFNNLFHEFFINYYFGVLHFLDSIEIRLQRIINNSNDRNSFEFENKRGFRSKKKYKKIFR
jgi:hypothetical protein